MKRVLLILVPFVVVLALGFGSYIDWSKATFVSREIKSRTGAKEVYVLNGTHAGDHWYGRAEIDK